MCYVVVCVVFLSIGDVFLPWGVLCSWGWNGVLFRAICCQSVFLWCIIRFFEIFLRNFLIERVWGEGLEGWGGSCKLYKGVRSEELWMLVWEVCGGLLSSFWCSDMKLVGSTGGFQTIAVKSWMLITQLVWTRKLLSFDQEVCVTTLYGILTRRLEHYYLKKRTTDHIGEFSLRLRFYPLICHYLKGVWFESKCVLRNDVSIGGRSFSIHFRYAELISSPTSSAALFSDSSIDTVR